MKVFSKNILLIFVLVFGIGLSQVSADAFLPGPKNKTDKRIKKQKKRQKRNPGDCPRIDCK